MACSRQEPTQRCTRLRAEQDHRMGPERMQETKTKPNTLPRRGKPSRTSRNDERNHTQRQIPRTIRIRPSEPGARLHGLDRMLPRRLHHTLIQQNRIGILAATKERLQVELERMYHRQVCRTPVGQEDNKLLSRSRPYGSNHAKHCSKPRMLEQDMATLSKRRM